MSFDATDDRDADWHSKPQLRASTYQGPQLHFLVILLFHDLTMEKYDLSLDATVEVQRGVTVPPLFRGDRTRLGNKILQNS